MEVFNTDSRISDHYETNWLELSGLEASEKKTEPRNVFFAFFRAYMSTQMRYPKNISSFTQVVNMNVTLQTAIQDMVRAFKTWTCNKELSI